jgi:enoyl-[acyl-carrier protein] reductase I
MRPAAKALKCNGYQRLFLCGVDQCLFAALEPGASVMCLTYYGSVKVAPHYNVMGVAKAALESSTRYLAYDLGPQKIRVNAISAGPIRTLAAAGVGGFRDMYKHFADMSPMRENVTIEDVGNSAVFLASDLSRRITGEVCMWTLASTPLACR